MEDKNMMEKECLTCIHNKAWAKKVILSGIADQNEYNSFCKNCHVVLDFYEEFDRIFDEVMNELEKEQKEKSNGSYN